MRTRTVVGWVAGIAVAVLCGVAPAAPEGSRGPPRIARELLAGTPVVVIIDVRRESHWQESSEQIAGAVREDPGNVAAWADKYAPEAMIVVYCS